MVIWFDSDDEINLPGCYESDQEFVQASEMMNEEKVNLKDESQQVDSESQSRSDEFDASGYYVGKKIRPCMRYEFSDSSVPFSGLSDSSSYDSDVTSKPSCFGDEFNDVLDQTETQSDQGGDNYKANLEIESEHAESESESDSGSDEFDASGYYVGKKIKRRCVYEFSDSSVPFSGFGIVLDQTETESETESSSYDSDATSKPSERLESRCIKTRNVLGKRGFPIECGSSVSSVPCIIKKRKVSSKRDSAVESESIESGITRRSVSGKRS